MNPRAIAYRALIAAYREETFLETILHRSSLEKRDLAFAQEIAYGTMRRTLTLDFYAKQLTPQGKLKVKLKEKVLLRMALYQHLYMDKVPLFAIVNETMELAKRECHSRTLPFLHALLRNLDTVEWKEPSTLSLLYSFPDYFVQKLTKDYPGEEEKVLAALNQPPQTLARKVGVIPPEFVPIREVDKIHNSKLYIQNPTPAHLLHELLEDIPATSILDLCAAPGGKTILAHDLYPDATITANDIAEEKRERMQENFSRLNTPATIVHFPGQEFPTNERFDLIIIDAPCSNTGVLHKRPEARWRLNKESTDQLVALQQQLLTHSLSLLNEGGHLLYLTCSILHHENKELVAHFCQKKKVRCLKQRTYLPNGEFDGGYGALISP